MLDPATYRHTHEGYVVFQRDFYAERCLCVAPDRKTAEDKRREFGPGTEVVYGRYYSLPEAWIDPMGPLLPPIL